MNLDKTSSIYEAITDKACGRVTGGGNKYVHAASCSSGGKGIEQARNIEQPESGPERSRGRATSISRVIPAAAAAQPRKFPMAA